MNVMERRSASLNDKLLSEWTSQINTFSDVDSDILREARRQQSAEMARLIKKGAKAVAHLFGIFSPSAIMDAFDRAHVFERLAGMSDAQLAKLGIDRTQIPQYVDDLFARKKVSQEPVQGTLPFVQPDARPKTADSDNEKDLPLVA